MANPLTALQVELREALDLYWTKAARILTGSGVTLLAPPDGYDSLEKNFFSALFLHSYERAGIEKPRRIVYGAINQCLRGMVTGCDNILDDEYKKTLETDLPDGATRFRSVLDIMVSDRVLFEILLTGFGADSLPLKKMLEASATSLRALVRSGSEEAAEEMGINAVLEPDLVLTTVHHFKTGLLFQSPWAVPMAIENVALDVVRDLQTALYNVGMGCQIMDDMVDLASDAKNKRHNFTASLIRHEGGPADWHRLQSLVKSATGLRREDSPLLHFPLARGSSEAAARRYLRAGLSALFSLRHQHLVEPAMAFLIERIGAGRFMAGEAGATLDFTRPSGDHSSATPSGTDERPSLRSRLED